VVPNITTVTHRPLAEPLEARRLCAVDAAALEQYFVELVNRARADPAAEARRFAGYADLQGNTYDGDLNEGLPAGTISGGPKQPLAVNAALASAARGHAEWMRANSTFSHTGSGGSSPQSRMAAAGYAGATMTGENLAAFFTTGTIGDPTAQVEARHRDLFADLTVDGRGHRTNLLHPDWRETGAGYASGPYQRNGQAWTAALVAQDFGTRGGEAFLTGVAYDDRDVRDDDFYTPGEGIGGVTVTATAGGGSTYTTATSAAGGYALRVPDGTYTLTASGGAIGGTVTYGNVVVDGRNAKRDFTAEQAGQGPPPLVAVSGSTATLTGTDAADAITVGRAGDQLTFAMNGRTQSVAASTVEVVKVLAGGGADTVTVGPDVIGAFILGEAGDDSIVGSDRGDQIDAGPGRDYVDARGDHDRVRGGDDADTLTGGAGKNVLFGDAGDDRLNGSGGRDELVGGTGNDRLYGRGGDDRLDGQGNVDRLFAGTGHDTLVGGTGNDKLYAEAGDDVLTGGGGTDLLHGGAGTDRATDETVGEGVLEIEA